MTSPARMQIGTNFTQQSSSDFFENLVSNQKPLVNSKFYQFITSYELSISKRYQNLQNKIDWIKYIEQLDFYDDQCKDEINIVSLKIIQYSPHLIPTLIKTNFVFKLIHLYAAGVFSPQHNNVIADSLRKQQISNDDIQRAIRESQDADIALYEEIRANPPNSNKQCKNSIPKPTCRPKPVPTPFEDGGFW